jgi:peptide/nickel transport system substrate-binding protein
MGADEFREKNGERLTIRLLTTAAMPDTLIISQAIQAQAKEAGIDVQIVQVDDIYSAREEPNWDVSFASSLLTFSGAPDQGITELLTTGGPVNYAKISDPELDALAVELRRTFDMEERHAILGDIQRIISERGYYAVAAQRILTVVAGSDWQGYQVPVANLWVDAKTSPSA